jgi:hypothetical protein
MTEYQYTLLFVFIAYSAALWMCFRIWNRDSLQKTTRGEEPGIPEPDNREQVQSEQLKKREWVMA